MLHISSKPVFLREDIVVSGQTGENEEGENNKRGFHSWIHKIRTKIIMLQNHNYLLINSIHSANDEASVMCSFFSRCADDWAVEPILFQLYFKKLFVFNCVLPNERIILPYLGTQNKCFIRCVYDENKGIPALRMDEESSFLIIITNTWR